jgi:hypothetical protein
VDEEKPVKEAELGDQVIRGAGRLETMPEIPTPTWAFWIMATTLAQSPMANVTACVSIFTVDRNRKERERERERESKAGGRAENF